MAHIHFYFFLCEFFSECEVTPREPDHHICSFAHFFWNTFRQLREFHCTTMKLPVLFTAVRTSSVLYVPPLAFPDPCSSGEFSKDVAHSQFGCYVTCSASDSKPYKLFTDLLFTLWKRIRLFWMPQSATAHDTFCNARHSAFLMSEGCT